MDCKERRIPQFTLHSQCLWFGCTARSLPLGLDENYCVWTCWKAMLRKTPLHVPLRIKSHINAQ
ncbi:hypothetical protein M405DRAFT_804388 [Rhizopogon salebrosus TDB-379]|nr:hypothetical protein M405DRAFT_804388 [Rhizopogon salebrosus TDB-379]